ncbi:unnamed protein product, partial [Staurois parvus]
HRLCPVLSPPTGKCQNKDFDGRITNYYFNERLYEIYFDWFYISLTRGGLTI